MHPSKPQYTPDLEHLRQLLKSLDALRDHVIGNAEERLRALDKTDPTRRLNASIQNVAHYLALRTIDLRDLQEQLADQGLSSLGRCEAHVVASLNQLISLLGRIIECDQPAAEPAVEALDMAEGDTLLLERTDQLLGGSPPNRRVRIMVTMPTEASADYAMVKALCHAGMNLARINCAHDDVGTWSAMIENIRRAERETGRACRVVADLAGHKVRTGALAAGPSVLHLRPIRDLLGRITRPTEIELVDAALLDRFPAGTTEHGYRLGMPGPALEAARKHGQIAFRDTRGRRRRLRIKSGIGPGQLLGECRMGAYVSNSTAIVWKDQTEAERCQFAGIPALQAQVRLFGGDALRLTRELIPGEPAQVDANGRVTAPAHIACTCPEVFSVLRTGQAVWIDDGKMRAVVESIDADGANLRIDHIAPNGARLLGDKGLNFPGLELPLPALSAKDISDLDALGALIDAVSFSFVESATDLTQLLDLLGQRHLHHMGVIAKIETARAVRNLPQIIFAGLGKQPFGVMIARGDLAVEIGPERLAEIQEEILWLCEAAHVPVIWATQVLETLAKKGIISRPELTDAAMSERAECVMLNKGPFILQALQSLDDIITRMQAHQHKKTSRLRALHW